MEKVAVNKRVIVRSNEYNDPLIIGRIIDYEDLDGKAYESLPIVISEEDEKKYLCMGIAIEYSDKLLNKLEKMDGRKQWEFLRHKIRGDENEN